LAIILVSPSVVWIFRDLRVWPWDQAYYAELALKIHYATEHGPLAALKAFVTVPDSRAPLLPWLAQAVTPLIWPLGSAERALLLTNIAAGAVTLWLVYSATRRFGGDLGTALVAMLLGAGTSDFIAFNHQFLVESVQSMAVAGVACITLRADRFSWPRLAAATMFWVALALLAKTTSVGFVLPFLLYMGIVCVAVRAKRESAIAADTWLLLGASLLVAATIIWYAMNWHGVVGHIIEATKGSVALLYGAVRPLPVKLQFWSRELLRALSPFPWLAGLISLVSAVAVIIAAARQLRGGLKNLLHVAVDSGLLFALCLAGTIVAGLLAYSRAIEEDPRFLAPMVPLVVLLFSWSLATLQCRWLTVGAAALLAFNWAATHAVAQGLVSVPHALGYLTAPRSQPASIERMTEAVREGCDPHHPDRVNIIGAELSDFSAVSAWFFAEKLYSTLGYRCTYTSLGYPQRDLSSAIKRIYEVDPDFIVTLPLAELRDDEFNHASKPVAEWLATSPDFKRITPAGDVLAIYRKR
jgi:Dolichyl-phosphate-mannose-protein mannosyltransferase